MREAIVLLARPGARFDVVHTTDAGVPICFQSLHRVFGEHGIDIRKGKRKLTILMNLAYCTIIV